MNDLRSENRAPLAPVRSIGPKTGEVVSSGRPKTEPGPGENQLFRRTSSDPDSESSDAETEADVDPLRFQVSRDLRRMPTTAAGRLADSTDAARTAEGRPGGPAERDREGTERRDEGGPDTAAGGEAAEPSGRRGRASRDSAAADSAPRVRRNQPPTPPTAPANRPAKRRDDADEAEEAEDDKFPWHHHFEDDEPAELQAKSRLLSRAFRSSVG